MEYCLINFNNPKMQEKRLEVFQGFNSYYSY